MDIRACLVRCSEVTVDACQPSAGADGSAAAVRCETRVPHGRHLLSVGLYWNETGTSQATMVAAGRQAVSICTCACAPPSLPIVLCPPALPLHFRPPPSSFPCHVPAIFESPPAYFACPPVADVEEGYSRVLKSAQ